MNINEWEHMKEAGRRHINRKKDKKGRNSQGKRETPKYSGNSSSWYKENNGSALFRVRDKQRNQDQINYSAQDFNVSKPVWDKTAAPRYEDIFFSAKYRERPNKQIAYQYESSQPATQNIRDLMKSRGLSTLSRIGGTKAYTPQINPLRVRLPKLHENLWLSNLDFAKEARNSKFLEQRGIGLVINLSGYSTKPRGGRKSKYRRRQRDRQLRKILINTSLDDEEQTQTDQTEEPKREVVYMDFYLQDHEAIPYQTFEAIMFQGVILMKKAFKRGDGVLIHCGAGINRSVSMIVAWASIHLENHPDETIKYIEGRKLRKGHNFWDTMTNRQFYRYLNTIHRTYGPDKD